MPNHHLLPRVQAAGKAVQSKLLILFLSLLVFIGLHHLPFSSTEQWLFLVPSVWDMQLYNSKWHDIHRVSNRGLQGFEDVLLWLHRENRKSICMLEARLQDPNTHVQNSTNKMDKR